MASRIKQPFPPVALVKERVGYDPLTGALTWNGRYSIRIKHAGAVITGQDSNGYVSTSINYCQLRGHQLAWVCMTGEWPTFEIDHINGVKADNRWVNLRAADRMSNMANLQRARADSRTGLLGATYHAKSGRYTAEIKRDGVRRYIGCFGTAQEAHESYMQAKTLAEQIAALKVPA